jgi:hypothetical protein
MESLVSQFQKLEEGMDYDGCIDEIDKLMNLLDKAKSEIQKNPTHYKEAVQSVRHEVDQVEEKVAAREKATYGVISKFGKAVEKTFKSGSSSFEPDSMAYPSDFDSKNGLNKAILMHLERTGDFNVANTYMTESGMSVPDSLVAEFARMYHILYYISKRELQPAIEWAMTNRRELMARGSNLEFVLHKMQFLRYLFDEHDSMKALNYAQQYLSTFGDRYLDDISRLMSSMLYVNKLESSPYSTLYRSPSYEQLHSIFASEFCSLLGLPPQSPLYLAVTAGSIALPTLAKIQSVMKSRGAEWTTRQELPVEIDFPDMFQFHSIFVCPVSKEQTTDSNPPMMLPCGHILANSSLKSLGKDNPNHPFKCPYCPVESTFIQARRVYF